MSFQDDARQPSNPTSALLQDMLREKKAQTQRVGSRNGLDDRNTQSSPLGVNSTRHGSSGQGRRSGAVPKEIGMREMEDHVSKINKQNFDLKLEVFHLRQRNEALEGKVDRLDALEIDNEEMQAINEDLLLELEKRDVAIQEAVGLICELEAKIEDMADAEAYFARHSMSPGPDSTLPRDTPAAPLDSASQDPKSVAPTGGSSPNDQNSTAELSVHVNPLRQDTLSPPPKSPRRVPSFVLDAKKSTNALRSLYSGSQSYGNPSSISLARPDSALSGDEDEDDWANQQMLNSPRLSVLSESGFSSIYNYKDNELTPGSLEGSQARAKSPMNVATSPRNNQREVRLQRWAEEGNRSATPTRPLPNASDHDQFSSIGQVLEKVPSPPKTQKSPRSPRQEHPLEQQSPRDQATKGMQARQKRPSSPSFGGPIFGGGYLPPTPETMSTTTVAGNSSTPSIVTEKSLLDRPHTSGSGSFQSHLATALDFNGRNAEESSDDEQALPRPKGSHPSLRDENAGRSQFLPRTGGEATRRLQANAPAIRPSLTTSGTAPGSAMIFSSEAYMPSQASRTSSYPSPTGSSRRDFDQLSPTSSISMTPTKRTPSGRSPRSPISTQEPLPPIAFEVRQEATPAPKLGRSASLRSRMAAKMTKTPTQSTHQSVASRLFRRTATQPIHNPANRKAAHPSRPPISRAPSSHARVPRPSSLYNGAQPLADPTYTLSSLLPNEMLTDLERYSSSSNRQ